MPTLVLLGHWQLLLSRRKLRRTTIDDFAKIRTKMLLAAQLIGEDARSNEARQAWRAIVVHYCCTKSFTVIVISRLSAHGRLKFAGQKTGVGVYTENPFVRITHIHTDHKSSKNGDGRLHGDGRLLGRIR